MDILPHFWFEAKYVDFKNQYNRFPLGKEMQWVQTMKHYFKNGKLSENQINAILNVNPTFFENLNKAFENNLDKYVDFKNQYNRFPLGKEMQWVQTMKHYFKNGKLSENEIKAILNVNPYFFEKISLKWKQLLKKYECFLLSEYREPTYIEMQWHIEQRSLFNKGKLSQEKINALLNVNPTFFEKQSKIRIKNNIKKL